MIYTKDVIKKKLDRKEKISKILRIIYFPIITLVILGSISIIFQKIIEKQDYANIFGYKSFVVLTGSMEPNINVGNIIFVKKTNENDIKVGDVITYSVKNSKGTITHRIIDIVEQDGKKIYKTKGDNNNTPDTDVITYENIIGTVSFQIYKLGLIMNRLANTGGIAAIALVVLICWSYSSKKTNRLLAREEARKKYNIRKYKGNKEDTNDSI